MLASELRPGELEIVEPSTEIKLYKCGHVGTTSFKLRMDDWDITSPPISQDEECPDCIKVWTVSNLHRCPVCDRVYEVVPGSNSVAKSSFIHFLRCFTENVAMEVRTP